MQVRIHNFLKKSKRARDGDQSDQNDQNEGAIKQREILRKRVRKLMKNRRSVEICKLVRSDDEIKPWGRDAQAKVRCSPFSSCKNAAFFGGGFLGWILRPLLCVPFYSAGQLLDRAVDGDGICSTSSSSVGGFAARHPACLQAHFQACLKGRQVSANFHPLFS